MTEEVVHTIDYNFGSKMNRYIDLSKMEVIPDFWLLNQIDEKLYNKKEFKKFFF